MIPYLIIAFLVGYILATKRPPAPSQSRRLSYGQAVLTDHPLGPQSQPQGQTTPAPHTPLDDQLPSVACVAGHNTAVDEWTSADRADTPSYTERSPNEACEADVAAQPEDADDNPWYIDRPPQHRVSDTGWGHNANTDKKWPSSKGRDKPPHIGRTRREDNSSASSGSSSYGSGKSGCGAKRHVSQAHKPEVAVRSVAGSQREECEICEEVFQSRMDLRNHKKGEHAWAMLCTTCLQTFRDGFAALQVHHGAGDVGFEGIATYLAGRRPDGESLSSSDPEPASIITSSATSAWSDLDSCPGTSLPATRTPSRNSQSATSTGSSDSSGWPDATASFPVHVIKAENVCPDCWANFAGPGALELHRQGPCDPTPPPMSISNYPPLPRHDLAFLASHNELKDPFIATNTDTEGSVSASCRAWISLRFPSVDRTHSRPSTTVAALHEPPPPEEGSNSSITCYPPPENPIIQKADFHDSAGSIDRHSDTALTPPTPESVIRSGPLIGHAIPTQVKSVSPVAPPSLAALSTTSTIRDNSAPEDLADDIAVVEQIPSFALPTSPSRFAAFSLSDRLIQYEARDVPHPAERDVTADNHNTATASKPTDASCAATSMDPDDTSLAAEVADAPGLRYYHPPDNYMSCHPSRDPPPPLPAWKSAPLTLSGIAKRQQSYKIEVAKAKARDKKVTLRSSGQSAPTQPQLEPQFDDDWTSFGGEATPKAQGGLAAKAVDFWGSPRSEDLALPRFGGW